MLPSLAHQRPFATPNSPPRSPPAAAASQPRSASPIAVRSVATEQQLLDFKAITRNYLEWLGEDLGFQGVERELANLPGSYAAESGGCMLVAYDQGEAGEVCVGAVALRCLAGHTSTVSDSEEVVGVPLEQVCEMKRLFVLPGHHGRGAGAVLVRALVAEAERLGYRTMVLDTLDRLTGANRLYSRLGFQPCERYNDCPLPGVLYFARRLGGLMVAVESPIVLI